MISLGMGPAFGKHASGLFIVMTCFAVSGLVFLDGASSMSWAAGPNEIECKSGDVCRISATRLPLRLLPRVQANIYAAADKSSALVEGNVTPFSPLFVFARKDIDYSSPTRPKGWFQVGKTQAQPIGFMHAEDGIEWKSALTLSYTHRGTGTSQRKPVIMFKDAGPLEKLALSQDLPVKAADLYTSISSGSPPDTVITREPDTFVDIRRKFYMLPVIDVKDLSSEGLDDTRLLQLAAAVPDRRQRPDDACTTDRGGAAFAQCSRDTGRVSQNEFKVDVVYVMDFTGSMEDAIDTVRRATRNSALAFSRVPNSKQLRFGLVAYRDTLESGPQNEFVAKNFTPTMLSQEQFVKVLDQNAKTSPPAGDWEEEVFAGLKLGLESKWENGIRLMFLIGDASGHEPTHAQSTTGIDERAIREVATQQGIYIAAVYIKRDMAKQDWARGIEQFQYVATNPGGVAFKAADPADLGSIESSIAQLTDEAIERLKDLYRDQSNPGAGSASAGRPLIRAFESALVEFLGKATEPPKDITAWALDRDLTNLGRKSFDVHVLVTRSDVDQLADGLQKLLEAYDINELTNEGFFKSLQSITTLAALDVDLSRRTALAKTNLLPRWIDSLPYKSEITSLTFANFEEQTADKRQQMQIKLRSLVALYKSLLERRDAWIRLNDAMTSDEMVYPLPLDNLP